MSSSPLTSPGLAAPTRTTLLRSIFSFPVAAGSLLVVLATYTVRGRFDDPDMWWHLKLGQVIWTTHRIPHADTFSFTASGQPTIPHEWLAQLSLFGFYRFAGYSGIMLWLCVVASALPIAGYALCAIYSSNVKLSFLGALPIWFFSTVALAPRPQLLGYLCLLLELLVLHLGRSRSPRWFLALPALFALWINCHGSFLFGLIIGVLTLLSPSVPFRAGAIIADPLSPRARRLLASSLALSLPALLLNPAGWKTIAYPARILFHSPVNLANVSEWQPLRLNDPRGVAFLCVCAGILLLPAMRVAVLYLHEALILCATAFAAARHERLLIAFGVVAAPILCRMLRHSWENYSPERDRPLANLALILSAATAAFLGFPNARNLAAQVAASSPVAAADYIHTHNLTGPMLNQYVFGGYLIWAAPGHPVFIDGRADIFERNGVLAEYGQWATLQADPRALLDRYGIRFILLAQDSPMVRVLTLLPGWKLAYSDHVAVIFVRETS